MSEEKLRAALKPFADCFTQICPTEDDAEWAKFRLTIGDYRRAWEAFNTPASPTFESIHNMALEQASQAAMRVAKRYRDNELFIKANPQGTIMHIWNSARVIHDEIMNGRIFDGKTPGSNPPPPAGDKPKPPAKYVESVSNGDGTYNHDAVKAAYDKTDHAEVLVNVGFYRDTWVDWKSGVWAPGLKYRVEIEPDTAGQHDLYKTSDADAPDQIRDRNGEVALDLCKRCNRGESELSEPCTPPLTPFQLSNEALLHEVEKWMHYGCGADPDHIIEMARRFKTLIQEPAPQEHAPKGWQLVPVEITPEQIARISLFDMIHSKRPYQAKYAKELYDAFLESAPVPPSQPSDKERS